MTNAVKESSSLRAGTFLFIAIQAYDEATPRFSELLLDTRPLHRENPAHDAAHRPNVHRPALVVVGKSLHRGRDAALTERSGDPLRVASVGKRGADRRPPEGPCHDP